MQGYIVSWDGMKTKVAAESPKHAAHLLLLERPAPRSRLVTVFEQETEDGDIQVHIFKISERRCAACGCTEKKACEAGCCWVNWDLCSACVAKSQETPRSDASHSQFSGRSA